MKKIRNWQIIAILFTLVVGTLLHFTYEWSGENKIIGTFSAINESTWEHLKLIFFPMLIFSIFEGIKIYKETNNYIEAKAIGIIFGILFITIFFFTYTGIIGTNFAVLDIGSFIIGTILSEILAYMIIKMKSFSTKKTRIISISILVILAILFVIFTFNPLNINYFRDPVQLTL